MRRFQDAAEWASKALEAPVKNSPAELVKAQVYPLRALALAGLGRAEEGLKALEQGQAVATEAGISGGLSGYSLVKADLLLRLGKPAEAAAAVAELPMPPLPKISLYELNLRRRVARAAADATTSALIEQTVRAFLASPGANPSDPIFARRLAAALDQDAPAPDPVSEPGESFGEVSEGLERMRRREPDNETLKRLAMADLKRLSRSCQPDEVVVMPSRLKNSMAFVLVQPSGVRLLEVFCDQRHLEQAGEALLMALSAPSSRPETQQEEWTYLTSHLIAPWRKLAP